MAINPMNLMKLKGRFQIFKQQHPKFLAFLKVVNAKALEPGAVLTVKMTTVDGKEYETNIRLTKEDVETVRLLVK